MLMTSYNVKRNISHPAAVDSALGQIRSSSSSRFDVMSANTCLRQSACDEYEMYEIVTQLVMLFAVYYRHVRKLSRLIAALGRAFTVNHVSSVRHMIA